MTAPAAPRPDLPLRHGFAAVIEALCRHVADEGARRRIAGPLIILIWQRLRRLATRFARLGARPAAPSRARRPGHAASPRPLPRGFAWLIRLIPGTAAIGAQFRTLLDTPDMQALIRANPATGRLLRPLCHTLGIRPPAALRLESRPQRPSAARHIGSQPQRPSAAPCLEPLPKRPPAAAQPLIRPDPAPASPPAMAPPAMPPAMAPPPDHPGWPRAPGAARFIPPRRKHRP